MNKLNLRGILRVCVGALYVKTIQLFNVITLRNYRLHREIALNGATAKAAEIAFEGVDMKSLALQVKLVNAVQEIAHIFGLKFETLRIASGLGGLIRNEMMESELESVVNEMFRPMDEITMRAVRMRAVRAMCRLKDIQPHQLHYYIGGGDTYVAWLNEPEFRHLVGKNVNPCKEIDL